MIDIRDEIGDLRYSVEVSGKSIYHKELMAEEYILLTFNSDKLVRFKKGDYIETEFGRFEIITVNKPTIDNRESGAYVYEQRFYPSWAKWSKRKLMYDRQDCKEVSFKLTQVPGYFLDIIVSNLADLGFGTYTYEIDASLTEMKFIEFESVNIIEALTLIAEAWETEWWITDNIIHLSKCEYGTPVEFVQNEAVIDMQREDSQDQDYVTRLYAFGSTKNLPSTYRKDEGVVVEGVVQKRLHLPAGIDYVDAWENMAEEEVVEGVAVLDNIYPKRVGTMTTVTTKEYNDTIENEDGTTTKQTWNAYRFTDSGIRFSEKYRIDGEELRIVFQTGKLAGMDFVVNFNPDGKAESSPESQVFEIVRSNDYGVLMPSDTFHPEVKDEYILYGFNTEFISAQLLPEAEQELLETAKKIVAKKSEDKSVYNCPSNPIWCAGYRETADGKLVHKQSDEIDLQVGQRVKLISEYLFKEGFRESRVRMFEKRLDNKFNCEYSIGNESTYSKTGELSEKIDALTYQTKQYMASGGSPLYVIKRYDGTIASDFNVYSALRQKIEFLSKKYDDVAQGLITFMKGSVYGEFAEGITGFGGKIDGKGNAWLDSLSLRKFLEVPELRYNRVTIQIGNKWNAPGGGIIERCVPDVSESGEALMTGTVYLHLEDGEVGTVAVDDICQGIFHDGMKLENNSSESFDDGLGNFKFTGFYTCYFRITEILDAKNSSFRYSLRGVSPTWNFTFHPCEAMHFVGYGNFSNLDRQTSRYSTRTYERYLRGVNNWEFNSQMIGAQFGDLSNLSIFGMNMEGYSAYLNNIYMSGVIEQFEHLDLRMDIDTEGDSSLAYGEHLHVTCKVFRGWEEKTSEVTRWEIIRDSGFAADDEAWALRPKVRNFAGVIDIHLDKDASIDDLGKSEISCLFTINAFLEGVEAPVTKQLVI